MDDGSVKLESQFGKDQLRKSWKTTVIYTVRSGSIPICYWYVLGIFL